MKNNPILFVTHEGIYDNLVRTQLFPFIFCIPERYNIYLITFSNRQKSIQKLQGNVISINISLSWKSYRSIYLLLVLLYRIKPARVHLRGLNLFPIIFICKIFKRFHLTLDPRGAFPEEILMRFNSKFLFYLLNFIEFIYFISGDSVIFVSHAFKKHIFSKYPYLKIKNVVIPTFYVESNPPISNFNFRGLNSESNELNLVYVGSMDVWQKFDKVVDFCNLLEKLRYPFTLHIITKDEITALKYLKASNFKNFTIKSLKPYEIADFLNRMDIAFVFREISTVNKVSSPVKIQEYLYSGLFVLLSYGIGDLSEFIRSNNLGYLLDDFTENEVVKSIKFFSESKSNRQDNIGIFLNHYDNSLKLNSYRKLFEYL